MGLDVLIFQKDKGGDPDLVRESQRRRYAPVEIVDEIIALIEEHKSTQYEFENAKAELKKLQKSTGALKQREKALAKSSDEADKSELAKVQAEAEALMVTVAAEKEKVAVLEARAKELVQRRDERVNAVGNIIHEDVPVSNDEANNKVLRTHGSETPAGTKLHHHEVLHRLYLAELERGVGVAGHRAYFLRGWGVRLNQALIAYGLDFLRKHGYTELQAPFFMRTEAMSKTCQLGTDDDLYRLGNEDAYLIATSEQPISAMHQGEWLQESELPIKYAGYSTCFRKEAGAHGKDVWGIFRVHQFEKVEQFVVTTPEKSSEALQEMLAASEEFYQSLGLSYRVVAIISKEHNAAAAQKFDLEAWFPARQDYRELVSCSNCTDYQSRALEVRCGAKKKDEAKKYVHMLNGTLCATERTLCCLLENFQDETGFVIPEVLRPYLGGEERIDFVREAPVETSKKTKAERRQQNPDAAKNGQKK